MSDDREDTSLGFRLLNGTGEQHDMDDIGTDDADDTDVLIRRDGDGDTASVGVNVTSALSQDGRAETSDSRRSSSNSNNASPHKKLAKTISLVGGIALIAGTMIGSGIFASPGSVLLHGRSVGMSLLAWFIAGVIALLGSLCYAELGTMIQESGGEYTYIQMAYGDLVAYIYIYSTVLVTKPGSLAIITLVSGQYIAKIIYNGGEPPALVAKLISVVLLATITLINSVSVSLANKVMVLFTSLKMLALILVGGLGMVWIAKDLNVNGTAAHTNFHDTFHVADPDTDGSPVSDFGMSILAALWSFDGWNNLNIVTEELKNPTKNLPLALSIGVPCVTLAYIVANIGYFATMPLHDIVNWDEMEPIEGFATHFGEVTMGEVGKLLLPLCIAASTFGAANGSAYTGGRLLYVSAKNGDFPKYFACLYGTKEPSPMRALAMQFCLGVLFLIPGDFESLLACFSVAAWIFYFLAVTTLFRFRIYEPNRPRPFRVWLAVPIVFCMIAACLVLAVIAEQPIESSIGIGIIITAIPVYYVRKKMRWTKSSTY